MLVPLATWETEMRPALAKTWDSISTNIWEQWWMPVMPSYKGVWYRDDCGSRLALAKKILKTLSQWEKAGHGGTHLSSQLELEVKIGGFQPRSTWVKSETLLPNNQSKWAPVAHTVIPATQKAEIRRAAGQNQPGQIVRKTHFEKAHHNTKGLVEWLKL
jgi:hypothetical protein